MALLGNGGILELSREWPEPMALAPAAINYSSNPKTISLNNDDYWTGDRVVLRFPDGVPFDLDGDGYADNPGGHGVYYGSTWDLSRARQHVTSNTDQYYQVSDSVNFYDTSTTQYQVDGYINQDQLGRIQLFGSELGAHNNITSDVKTISTVQTGNFVLARYSSSGTYANALTSAGNSIQPLTLPSASQELQEIITVPSGFATISNDPDARGWLFQADLQEWALDIDVANLDMTAIGETFGEHTKALVRGAGALTFFVDHKTTYAGQDSLTLLRLVLLTQQYCKSSAKFYIYKDRDSNSGKIKGNVYYECDLLLTNSRLNIRPDDAIAGTTDFVVTGEVAIRVAD